MMCMTYDVVLICTVNTNTNEQPGIGFWPIVAIVISYQTFVREIIIWTHKVSNVVFIVIKKETHLK